MLKSWNQDVSAVPTYLEQQQGQRDESVREPVSVPVLKFIRVTGDMHCPPVVKAGDYRSFAQSVVDGHVSTTGFVKTLASGYLDGRVSDREIAEVQGDMFKSPTGTDGDGDGLIYDGTPNEQPAPEKGDQTETKAFKKWFGDSKVVDEDGKPLVVYHGTNAEFTEFREGSSAVGGGIFFSVDREGDASSYAGGVKGARIMPVYLKADKVFDFRDGHDIVDFYNSIAPDGEKWEGAADFESLYEDYVGLMNFGTDESDFAGAVARGDYDVIESPEFISYLRSEGFDGSTLNQYGGGLNYMVFSPSQIKSATINEGTFDPDSNDIRKSFIEGLWLKGCGANKKGGGGFTTGNNCAASSGGSKTNGGTKGKSKRKRESMKGMRASQLGDIKRAVTYAKDVLTFNVRDDDLIYEAIQRQKESGQAVMQDMGYLVEHVKNTVTLKPGRGVLTAVAKKFKAGGKAQQESGTFAQAVSKSAVGKLLRMTAVPFKAAASTIRFGIDRFKERKKLSKKTLDTFAMLGQFSRSVDGMGMFTKGASDADRDDMSLLTDAVMEIAGDDPSPEEVQQAAIELVQMILEVQNLGGDFSKGFVKSPTGTDGDGDGMIYDGTPQERPVDFRNESFERLDRISEERSELESRGLSGLSPEDQDSVYDRLDELDVERKAILKSIKDNGLLDDLMDHQKRKFVDAQSVIQAGVDERRGEISGYLRKASEDPLEKKHHVLAILGKSTGDVDSAREALDALHPNMTAKQLRMIRGTKLEVVSRADLEVLAANTALSVDLQPDEVGGVYLVNQAKVVMDHPADRDGVLAHELGHAIDQISPVDRFSRSEEWGKVWSSEHHKLSRYAGESPQEGWAEFWRGVWTEPHNVRASTPKMWELGERWDLL